MRKIGIIGSAIVGQTLAQGFKRHGYDVRIGSRMPAKLADFSGKTGIASGTFADVAAWADAVVLAVKGTAAEEAIGAAGEPNLREVESAHGASCHQLPQYESAPPMTPRSEHRRTVTPEAVEKIEPQQEVRA